MLDWLLRLRTSQTTAVRTFALWWHYKGKHISHFIAETSVAETSIAETAAPNCPIPMKSTASGVISGFIVVCCDPMPRLYRHNLLLSSTANDGKSHSPLISGMYCNKVRIFDALRRLCFVPSGTGRGRRIAKNRSRVCRLGLNLNCFTFCSKARPHYLHLNLASAY